MSTWQQIWRGVQTVAVPILLSLALNYFAGKSKDKPPPPSLYLPILNEIGFVPRTLPVTYRADALEFEDYERVKNVTTGTPDTTAVLLNWARFPNVLLITSLLCGPWLDDTIVQVVIWNNNPTHLTFKDFEHTGCTKDKLKIHNAPGNMYFQGRFFACAGASTPYCFIQDDDYLIRPEIIQALRARIARTKEPHAIHLLPPHEHLSSILREIHVPKPDDSYLSDIHTSFAWLGHGTIMHRAKAEEFTALLRLLRLSSDEMKMADNYFSILSNRVPEVWFDQDFGLGGGNAFTVGEEGNERNAKHIYRAMQYLDSVARCGAASCDSTVDDVKKTKRTKVPYTLLGAHPPPASWTRAACSGATCVLDTNIKLLPDTMKHTSDSVKNMLALEAENLEALGEAGRQHYQDYPLSYAVDTHVKTAFQSFGNAQKDDIMSLDILADISEAREWQAVEMVWLVNADTEKILQASAFESSMDTEHWRGASQRPVCESTNMEDPMASSEETKICLRECSVQMVIASNALSLRATGRFFRVRLLEDMTEHWTVYEIWIRGL